MANTPTYDEKLEQVKNQTYEVDRNDERLNQVNDAKDKKLSEVTETYNGLIAENPYDGMVEATKKWEETQTDILNQKTDFTIQQIEQQREQAQKDYTKEQAGAYVDWRKQSNQYGTEAEKMASAGLSNTGFSESSQVSMYNTYQNRVATARESLSQAMLNYDNAIKDAQLQNNAALAEIAMQSLQKQSEYILQGVLRTEQLKLALEDKKMEVEKFYSDEWWKQYEYLNQEVQRDWETDQNELKLLWQKEENAIDRAHDLERDRINNEFAEKLEGIKHDYDIKLLNAKTEKDKEVATHEYNLAMQKLEEEHKNDLAILDKQLANEKDLLAYQKSLNSASLTGGNSGSSGSKKTTTKQTTTASINKGLVNSGQAKTISQYEKNNSAKSTNATMDSILALGYGPISATKLNELVASGVVEEYTKNGVTLFRKKVKSLRG